MKKIIRLTENEFHEIIKESIQTLIKDKIKEENFDINSIDISSIDIEILKQAYVDFRLIPTRTSYDNYLSNFANIKEAEGDIMPPDNVVNEITQKYHLKPQFVVKIEANNKIYIYIITACIGINDELIENDMKKMGYFLGCRGDVQEVYGMIYQVLQFEPYSQMQEDETSNIKKKYDFLYHWTPKYNLNEILKNGLVPNHLNKMFNYPNRIYLIKGDSNLFEMTTLGQHLCKINNDYRNNGEYILLKINLSNIDDNIHFYYDSNSSIGIYTEQSIPSNYINVIDEYSFKTEK